MPPDPKAGNPPEPPAEPNAEDAFWANFDTHLDSWLDRKSAEAKAQQPASPPGTNRTGAKRVTLPSLIADIVFGPPKD